MLESAARGLSRHGYGNLVLEQVAREAGYTRGALYHQFKDKEDLALAVLEWVDETWKGEVGELVEHQPDPVAALIALARGHAVYCRRDIARFTMALRLEFSGQDHPVGRELERISETLVKRCARLIDAGRKDGSIPAGPPARAVALAYVGALEGAVIALAGQAPHDELYRCLGACDSPGSHNARMPSGVAILLAAGEPERLYTGLSVLVSTATEGRTAAGLASFRALALLLDPDLPRRAREPEATPSLSWAGREAFAASLAELRDLAVELEGLSLHACWASVETMGLTAQQVAEGGLDGVMSTPRFLREFEGAALLFV